MIFIYFEMVVGTQIFSSILIFHDLLNTLMWECIVFDKLILSI